MRLADLERYLQIVDRALCGLIPGGYPTPSQTAHLRTPLQTGIDIMQRLQGRLGGIALPDLIVDTPGGFGKVPVGPDYVVKRDAAVTTFRSPRGVDVDYVDPE